MWANSRVPFDVQPQDRPTPVATQDHRRRSSMLFNKSQVRLSVPGSLSLGSGTVEERAVPVSFSTVFDADELVEPEAVESLCEDAMYAVGVAMTRNIFDDMCTSAEPEHADLVQSMIQADLLTPVYMEDFGVGIHR